MLQRFALGHKATKHLDHISKAFSFHRTPSRSQHRTNIPTPSAICSDDQFSIPQSSTGVPNQSTSLATLFPGHYHLFSEGDELAVNRLSEYIDTQPALSKLFSDGRELHSLSRVIAQSATPAHSCTILRLAEARGCFLNQSIYESVCFHLSSKKHYWTILEVTNIAKRFHPQITLRLLNWRAFAFLKTRQYLSLSKILDEFAEAGRRPSQRTYHILLNGCMRNYDLASARHTLQLMEKQGIAVDANTHALIAKHLPLFVFDPQIEKKSIEILPDLSSHMAVDVLNSLIQTSMGRNDDSSILRLLSFFDPKLVACFAVSLNSRGSDSPFQRPSDGRLLVPTAATFALFIAYNSHRNDIDVMIRIIQAMAAQRIHTTTSILIAVLGALFSSGFMDDAYHAFADICETANVPTSLVQPFRPLAQAQLHGLWSSLDTAHIPPSIELCNTMLKWNFDPDNDYRKTFSIFEIMRTIEAPWTTATIEIVASHLKDSKRAHPGALIGFLRQVASDRTISPRHVHLLFSSILRREKASRLGHGWGHLNPAWRQNRAPSGHNASNTSLYFDPTAGITVPDRPRVRGKQANTIIQPLISEQVKSDPYMIGLRLRRDAVIQGDMHAAQKVFESLLARGMRPDAHHFSALIEGYMLTGNSTAALSVLRSAEKTGVMPNVVMFTIIISGFARLRQPKRALHAFRIMLNRSITPDVACISALVGSYFAAGFLKDAKRLLKSLWTIIEPFPDELRDADLQTLINRFRSLQQIPIPEHARLTKSDRLSLNQQIQLIQHTYRKSHIRPLEQRESTLLRRRHRLD